MSCIPSNPSKRIHGPTTCLLVVAMLWATYGVSLRLIYADPDAPSAPVLTALFATITALSLSLFIRRDPSKAAEEYIPADPDACDVSLNLAPATPTVGPAPPGHTPLRLSFLRHPTRSIVLASLEIGCYAAMGSLLYSWGLSQIPAITGAFLVQTTTVFTPCISFLAGEQISLRVWMSTAAAALGTVCIFVDGVLRVEPDAQSPSITGSALGKFSVIAAAALYSMGTMRISQVASGFNAMNLAAGQAIVRALVSILTASPEIAHAIQASSSPALWLRDLWPNWDSSRALALVSWTALGPGSLALVLQMYGQRTVPAPSAEVIFTSTPIWAAMYSFLILSEKPFDFCGWLGAACILAASVGVANHGRRPEA